MNANNWTHSLRAIAFPQPLRATDINGHTIPQTSASDRFDACGAACSARWLLPRGSACLQMPLHVFAYLRMLCQASRGMPLCVSHASTCFNKMMLLPLEASTSLGKPRQALARFVKPPQASASLRMLLQASPGLARPRQAYAILSKSMQASPTLCRPLQASEGLCWPLQAYAALCRPLQASAGFCRSLQVAAGLCRGLCRPLQASASLCRPLQASAGLC